MRRVLTCLIALAGLLGPLAAETSFDAVDVTTTSQTLPFPTPRKGVTLCNEGTDTVHFRLFVQGDTLGAATTAHSKLPPGTADAPFCIGYKWQETLPTHYTAASFIAAASTATVNVYSQ